jgi:hypothetical protein
MTSQTFVWPSAGSNCPIHRLHLKKKHQVHWAGDSDADFLGMLHLEIITERLRREFSLELIVTTPSITYEIELKNGKKQIVYSPVFFPDDHEIENVREPWINLKIITPSEYVSSLMPFLYDHEAEVGDAESFGDTSTSLSASNRTGHDSYAASRINARIF